MLLHFRQTVFALIAVSSFALLGSSALAASTRFTGHIFTSDFRGAVVNQNHYRLKETVYLNGGPQNSKGGPTIPAGRYYFQVTDPSGRTVLSTDFARCRQIVVGAAGKIIGTPGDSLCEHQLGSDEYPGDPRPHDRPVLLAPFATSRTGGYKVWLIAQVSAVAGCVTPLPPASDVIELQFSSNCAKTDNFKVAPQSGDVCAPWEDGFNGTALDTNRWQLVTGLAPGRSDTNNGSFAATHVSVGGGLLTLTLTQTPVGQTQDNPPKTIWNSIGGLIRTHVQCGYGTYEWTMRMGSSDNTPSNPPPGSNVSGGVSAGFTYWNNSEHEIAFEHTAHTAAPPDSIWSPEAIWFVNFRNLDPTNRDPFGSEGTVKEEPLLPAGDVYNTFHRYKFVWAPGIITFYIDDVLFVTHTTNVPVIPGWFMIQYFGRNFQFFGGQATEGTRYFYVDYARFTPLP